MNHSERVAEFSLHLKRMVRLKKQLDARGITHDRVAAAAKVDRTAVVNVLAGRAKSRNVVQTAKRLLAMEPEERTRVHNGGRDETSLD